MELVRKYLTADEIGTPALRWNSDCDCVQQTPDGGTTWVDVPSADPRSAAGFALPPASSDNPQCDGAERMIAALKRLIDIVVQSAGSVAAVSAVLGYLADFLFGIGTLVALILEAVTGLLALGQEVLDAAFTSDVYDEIKCFAFNRVGGDGHFDDTGWTGFQSDVLAFFGGTINIAMGIVFQLEGINGFNNAASVGTETGDCIACGTQHYVVSANGSVTTTFVSDITKTYQFTVSGTFLYHDPGNYGDCQWNSSDGWASEANVTTYPPYLTPPYLYGLLVDENSPDFLSYEPTHVYVFTVSGTGAAFALQIGDDPYTDNSGGLSVDIEEV